MSYLTLGDLAQSLKLRQDNLRIRADLERLTAELSSGKKADVTAAVSGDFGALSGIENSITKLASFDLAIQESGLIVTGTQQVLEQVQSNMTELASALLLAQDAGQPSLVNTAAADARVRFESVTAFLNTKIADRTVFAGAATDGPAVADAQMMLDDLMILVAAETTAAGVETVIDTYFAVGGGYDVTGYLGATTPASPVSIGDDERVSFPATAASDEIRSMLAAFAKSAILDRGALTGLAAERAELARVAGEALLSTEPGIIQLRAETGAREDQVDRANGRNEAERAALELARSELISVDPFQVATELQAAEAQLESLYTLTARLSRLTLTEFLR